MAVQPGGTCWWGSLAPNLAAPASAPASVIYSNCTPLCSCPGCPADTQGRATQAFVFAKPRETAAKQALNLNFQEGTVRVEVRRGGHEWRAARPARHGPPTWHGRSGGSLGCSAPGLLAAALPCCGQRSHARRASHVPIRSASLPPAYVQIFEAQNTGQAASTQRYVGPAQANDSIAKLPEGKKASRRGAAACLPTPMAAAGPHCLAHHASSSSCLRAPARH